MAVTKDHLEQMTEAFTEENPWAKAAIADLSRANDYDYGTEKEVSFLASAQVNATLALAYEQRQTRYDLYVGIENHAQQTASV
jgi:hypothetical protein